MLDWQAVVEPLILLLVLVSVFTLPDYFESRKAGRVRLHRLNGAVVQAEVAGAEALPVGHAMTTKARFYNDSGLAAWPVGDGWGRVRIERRVSGALFELRDT